MYELLTFPVNRSALLVTHVTNNANKAGQRLDASRLAAVAAVADFSVCSISGCLQQSEADQSC